MGKAWLSSQNKGRWEHFGNVVGVLIGCWERLGWMSGVFLECWEHFGNVGGVLIGCWEHFWDVGSSSGTLGAFGVDVGSYFEME